jgi:hypothetical protein
VRVREREKEGGRESDLVVVLDFHVPRGRGGDSECDRCRKLLCRVSGPLALCVSACVREKQRACLCVCVCVRERERERE